MKIERVIFALLMLLQSGWAGAQEQELVAMLSPVVVTATLEEKTLDIAPGAVQVIDEKEIAALGAETVGDVLLYATSVMLTTGEGRNLGTSIRGLGSNHTLVLIDGRRLAASYKSQMDINQLPVLMIDRIEIVRGPVSALYGSEAIGGVVNIITRPLPNQNEGSIDLRAGLGPSAEQAAQARIGAAGNSARGHIGISRTDQDDWNSDGEAPDEIDQTGLSSSLGRLSFDLTENQTVTVGGEYSRLTRDGTRFYQSMVRDYEADDRRWNGFVQYDLQSNGTFSGMVRGYISDYQRTNDFDPAVPVDDEQRRLSQIEARGTYAVFDDLLLTAGAEFRQESLEEGGLDDDKSVDNGAGLIQADWQLGKFFNLVAGGRYDRHQNFGSRLTPRATLSGFIPFGRIWISYGQGFRAPNLNELYVTSLLKGGKETYLGNSDLDAETSESYETGIYLHHGLYWGQLTLFRNELEDLIAAEFISQSGTNKTYEYQNIDKAETEGAELEFGLVLPGNLTFAGQSAWLQTEDRTTGEVLPFEPKWKGGLTLAWWQPVWDFRAQLRWLYFGKAENDSGETVDPYRLTHLFLAKGVTPQFEMYAGIDNLLDEEHDDYTLSPRQFYIGCNYHF